MRRVAIFFRFPKDSKFVNAYGQTQNTCDEVRHRWAITPVALLKVIFFFFFFLRDFIFKKTLFEKLQYLKQVI